MTLHSKDFWAGLLFLIIGATASFIALTHYELGTLSRMGSGFFPVVLGLILSMFGIIAITKAFVTTGGTVERIHLRPLIMIVASVVLFGLLLSRTGLVPALLVLLLISASASSKFKMDWRAGLGLIIFVAFCAALFVEGLGLPMALINPNLIAFW